MCGFGSGRWANVRLPSPPVPPRNDSCFCNYPEISLPYGRCQPEVLFKRGERGQMLYQRRSYHHTKGTDVPFQEIVRIQQAETEALASIERARREADTRLNDARMEMENAATASREKAASEAAALISAAEAEAGSEREEILAKAQMKKAAILAAIEGRLDEAVAYVVAEVTGNVQDR